MAKTLSNRCQNIAKDDNSVNYILESLRDPFHKDNNPKGFINMGTAVNGLMSDLIKEKLEDEHIFSLAFHSSNSHERYNMYDYFQEQGIPRLQAAAAFYLDKFFNTAKPTNPNNICFGTGSLSCLDMLFHFIGDPGDLVLCVTPQYPMIEKMIKDRALLEMWPIPLTSDNNFKLTLDKVTCSYETAVNQNKSVCALILLNPGNPIGQILDQELLASIMKFCARKEIHLVVDEVYANSIHHNETNFKSILSYQDIPDPDRTHMLYGISKDFTLTKFRVGFVHTYNNGIKNAWSAVSPCQAIAYPIMIATARIFEDLPWCERFFKESTKRLNYAYNFVSNRLSEMNIDHVQAEAGFFIWANLSKFCQPVTAESETSLFLKLVNECKIYIVPASSFHSPQLGWFRILFTKPFEELKVGLARIEDFINNQ